jgi:energy-coupling factor transporter ATP-binding protein EcfA2
MYIKRIRIDDVRCFRCGEEGVDLDLTRPDGTHAGWTVVAGRNGTGKSSFLKALALAVAGPSAARSLQESFSGWIRSGQPRAYLGAELTRGKRDLFRDVGDLGPFPFWADLQLLRQEHGPEPSLSAGERSSPGSNAARGPWADNPAGWFLAGYGLSRRLSGHSADAARLMAAAGRLARLVSLFREDASLVECTLWLRNVYLRRLEKKPGAAELEHDVIALLNHGGLLPGGALIDHVDSEGLWARRDDVVLPLDDMSDGYRAVIALVLDLVMQMHASFEGFAIEVRGDSLTVPFDGVVLIDEIDAHLHIEWQKRIGFWLREHFPNIQFIVTTHSPFICQAADPRGLIRLPAPGTGERVEHVSDEDFRVIVNGGADDAAFTALFGIENVYSDVSEKRRARLAELEARAIRGTASAEEQAELGRLAASLPRTGVAAVERVLRKHEALR